jgi:hypothetical protein
MNHRRTLLQLALPLLLTAFAASAKAQTLQYQELDLRGRVKVTIPSHWLIRDAAGRQNIAAAANAVLDPTGSSPSPSTTHRCLRFLQEHHLKSSFESPSFKRPAAKPILNEA